MDRWTSKPVSCSGGLLLNIDTLLQGTNFPGSARMLQNYEPSLDGGYRRLSGTTKYDSAQVPGDADSPILGIKVAMGGVFAVRKLLTDNAIYFSSGSGWGVKLNSVARTGSVSKARFISYSITEPVVVLCDGVNYAWKYTSGSETEIDGPNAPANPKYAAEFKSRLALSGYGDGSKLTLSSPNDDEDYDGGNGAIEINVGDTVVGLKVFRETLVIFCENSIKRLVGNTSEDFIIEDVAKSIGCVSGDTIQEIAGDLIYLATDSLRSYQATERVDDVELGSVSQSIQPILRSILLNGFGEDDYSSCCIRQKSQYRVFVNNTDSIEADNLGILGKVQSAATVPHGNYEWGTIRGLQPYCADSEYTNNQELSVLGHPTSGYVHRMESGNTFDGTIIQAVYQTPDLTFDDATLRKVFHKLNILTEVEGNFEVQVNLLLERNSPTTIQPPTISLEQDGGSAQYGSAIYDTDTYGEYVIPIFKRNLIGSGFFGAFRFTSNNDKAPHRIDSFQVTFAQKARR